MGILSRIEQRSGNTSAHPRDPVIAEWWGLSSQSAAGFAVTPETALRVSAVWACVRVLAESVAQLPIKVFRRLDDGGKQPDDAHPLSAVLRRRPNGWQTSFEWREMGVAHQCLRGAAYSRIVASRRGERSLIPLHPDRVRAEQRSDGSLIYEYWPPEGPRQVLLQEEVLRVPFMVMDGVQPISPIGAQREAIGAALAAQDYGSRFFRNDAVPRAYLKLAGNFKTTDDKAKFRESWQETMTGVNRHKTPVLESNMELKELGMSNEDAQFLETRKFQVADIARIFRVPPHMIGDLERSTNNNIEHQGIEFVVHTMGPWLARWEQALARDLLKDSEQDTHFIEFNVAGLLRGDIKARYDAYTKGRQWGWLSANDVRRLENLNPIEGGGAYLTPLNMAPVGEPVNPIEENVA